MTSTGVLSAGLSQGRLMWVPAQLVCISHRHGLSWQTADSHWPHFPQPQLLLVLAVLQQQRRARENRAGSASWECTSTSVLVLGAGSLCPASTHRLLTPGLSHQGVFRMLWQVRVCYSPLFPLRDSCDSRICSTLCVITL